MALDAAIQLVEAFGNAIVIVVPFLACIFAVILLPVLIWGR